MTSTIGRADAFTLEHPVAVATGPAAVTYRTRGCVLVRLEDGDGHIGWGETYLGPGVAATARELGQLLIGCDARVGRSKLDVILESGSDNPATSALAIALDDLRGRQLGISIADLYGGSRRDSVRAYASSGGYRDGVDPESGYADDVAAALADGFSACKLRIGRFHPRRELAILERIRSSTAGEFELMVDANGAYSVPRALEVGRELGRLGYRWFEEPLIRFSAGMEYPGYEALAGLEIAVAAGEGLRSRSAFDGFLRRAGADILQPDVAVCGGVGEARFISEVAALRGVPCIPHAWGGAVLMAATLQLLAVMPEPSELPGIDSPLLEYDRFENRMRSELSSADFAVVDGYVAIPTGPGLGIDINTDMVRALTVI